MGMIGFEDVNQRFKTLMRDMEISRTRRVIEEVLMAVQSDAATMTPVDTSFLINSAYNKTWRTSDGWNGEVGYGAMYAWFVHEKPGTMMGTGDAWNPDAEPKFLEKAVKNVTAYDLPRIIQSQYSI